MITSEQEQDIVIRDSARQIQDTSLQKLTLPADSAGMVDSALVVKDYSPPDKVIYPVDTTSVCLKHLKEGEKIPSRPFHDDWTIIIVLVSAFIYATLSTFYGKIFNEVRMFMFFKGINDSSSRDTGALFHWQSNLLNLFSFANTALFSYCVADYYDFTPFGISGLVLWLIFFVIITIAVTSRFIICSFIGKISAEHEAFDEYSVAVYQSYRVLGFILFLITILLSYTTFLDSKSLLVAGFILISALFLMRLARLLLIFLKRNISILYLILYLCALEFLPVLMLIKYFSNLF